MNTIMTEDAPVLLIEDDAVDVLNIQRAMKRNNFGSTLHIAGNGKEALELLEQDWAAIGEECPRMILLDLNMP